MCVCVCPHVLIKYTSLKWNWTVLHMLIHKFGVPKNRCNDSPRTTAISTTPVCYNKTQGLFGGTNGIRGKRGGGGEGKRCIYYLASIHTSVN